MILVPFFEIPYRDKLAKNVNSQYVQVIPQSTANIKTLLCTLSLIYPFKSSFKVAFISKLVLNFETFPVCISISFNKKWKYQISLQRLSERIQYSMKNRPLIIVNIGMKNWPLINVNNESGLTGYLMKKWNCRCHQFSFESKNWISI